MIRVFHVSNGYWCDVIIIIIEMAFTEYDIMLIFDNNNCMIYIIRDHKLVYTVNPCWR